MVGIKYTQHNQTENITCMKVLSHISHILSRLGYVAFTFCLENQADGLGIPQSKKRAKKQHFTTTIQSDITYVVAISSLTHNRIFSTVLPGKASSYHRA